MGCKIFASNRTVCRVPRKKPTVLFSSSSVQSKLRTQTLTLTSSYTDHNKQTPIHTPKTELYTVNFRTLGACKLGISSYPDFVYNAEGGEGSGRGRKTLETGFSGVISVDFDVEKMYIPPLTAETTKFLAFPLPPCMKIDIVPEKFRGTINQESGQVDLEFKAKFCFSVWNIYKAAPLLVETVLTSEESEGTIRDGRGKRLDKEGRCRLVGVTTVAPVNDCFLNLFLGLPAECLAKLNVIISFARTYRVSKYHLEAIL
ncbi:unnamed protein product [Ilex paraguariensis]|uniref:Uncharacterized protein n=1 Tax=Ilex paraguariensis TaxID=185542 RepID=A0ABC8SVD2_9AQUA